MKYALSFWILLTVLVEAGSLQFEKLTQDVDATSEATVVTTDFNFTNKTNKPVTIAKSDPGCTCLKVQISGGKLKYEPGESGTVRATFDVGNATGIVEKVIALWLDSDAPDKPSMKLTAKFHIPVLIQLDPKTLTWQVGAKPEPKIIHIRMAEGKTIRVNSVKSGSPAFSYDLKTVEDGKKYDLVVTPLTIAQPGLSVIRLETDCELTKHRIQQVFAVVRK